MKSTLTEMGKKAKTASRALAVLPSDEKNRCLEMMARGVEQAAEAIK